MASCDYCGGRIGFTENSTLVEGRTLCQKCGAKAKHITQTGLKRDRDIEAEMLTRLNRDQDIEAVMLTTETAPNLNITKRIEIVTAECAFGMNIFKDLFAGVRDIVGGRYKVITHPPPNLSISGTDFRILWPKGSETGISRRVCRYRPRF